MNTEVIIFQIVMVVLLLIYFYFRQRIIFTAIIRIITLVSIICLWGTILFFWQPDKNSMSGFLSSLKIFFIIITVLGFAYILSKMFRNILSFSFLDGISKDVKDRTSKEKEAVKWGSPLFYLWGYLAFMVFIFWLTR
jgi:hypothetical protein